MATTPEILQKRFEMPAELGTVDVPRVLHAFRGVRPQDRRTMLGAVYPALMSGALAAEGQHRRATRAITQHEMARRAGVSRVTITRRLSKLSKAAKGYESAADRHAHARELRAKAEYRLRDHKAQCDVCAAGESPCSVASLLTRRIGQVRDESSYQRMHVPIINRHRRFAMPNRYSLAMPERTEIWAVIETETGVECKRFFDLAKATKACERLTCKAIERGSATMYQVEAVKLAGKSYHFAELEQLAANAITGAWWDKDFKSHGFKNVSRWMWDNRILDPDTGKPLGTTERLIMSAYEEMGLLEEFKDTTGKVTKARGVLPVRQKHVARYVGCSVKSVYAANGKWERLGVLRIVSGEAKLTESGYKRGPQKVLYLPFKMLTDAEAEKEAQRMAAQVRQIIAREGAQRFAQLQEAQRLHAELLAAWRGREHCLVAFWRELARRLDAALIFPDLITKLIPPTRPEPERS
jgi:transcriptional regulator with XRE-family HTH domain